MHKLFNVAIAMAAALFIAGPLAPRANAQAPVGGEKQPADPPKPADAKPTKPADVGSDGKPADAKPATKADGKAGDAKGVTAANAKSVLDFSVPDIDGKETQLRKYKGKVLLIVNTASKCGYTPQYEGLEAMYEKLAAQGLAIAAFPANNFGGQEPGTNSEIKTFCSTKYTVTFDLFSKVSVKGNDCCELFKYLTGKDTNGPFAGEIKWNFTKFLVDRDGKVVARFEPKETPQQIAVQVEKLLTEKPADKPEKDARSTEARPN